MIIFKEQRNVIKRVNRKFLSIMRLYLG